MKRLILAAVVLLYAAPACAWNALGHKVIAEICWRELDPAQRQRIVDTLRRHPRFHDDFVGKMTDDVLAADKASQDRWIFQHAATWPDIARGLPAYERSKYDRPTWHYINLPTFLNASDGDVLKGKLSANVSAEYPTAIDKREYNVLQAIAYSRDFLSRKGEPASQALAYCWLFHLVGDLHQPLHATALYSADQFPEGDRGGNSIPLVRGDNLHALWDNLLGRRDLLRDVDKEAAELSDRARYGDVWAAADKEAPPGKWAEESRELAESFAYDEVIRNAVRQTPPGMRLAPINLPESYYNVAGEHARRRIVMAGVRLARLLEATQPAKRVVEPEPEFSTATNRAPVVAVQPMTRYWLNESSGVRHNESCKWFGKTKRGRYCSATDGKPCGECGG